MSNQDGKVIIQISSNANSAAKEFENLDNKLLNLKFGAEKMTTGFKALSNTKISINSDTAARKLKILEQESLRAVNSFQKLTNASKSLTTFNNLSGQTSVFAQRLKDLALRGQENSLEFQRMAAAVKNAKLQMSNADSIVNKATGFKELESSVLNLNNVLGAFSVGYITSKLAELGTSAVNTTMDFQALTNRFNAAAADKSIGANSLSYIRDEADRLGLSFKGTADSFAGFEAAALRSGLKLGETKQIFSDVSTAATSMQLPAQNVELTFKALEQIAGKGTVSMEELRQQLGDHLPGAFEIAAKSMGMTTRQFYDMVSEGKVLSSDFLPKFAKALKDELGGSAVEASTQLRASMNRLNTDLFDSSNAWGKLLSPSVQKGVESLRSATQVSTSLANILNKNSADISHLAQSLTSATAAFAIFKTAGLIQTSNALTTTVFSINSLKTSLAGLKSTIIANPLLFGGVAVALSIGAVNYALQQNNAELTKAAQRLRELSDETINSSAETPRLVAEFHNLSNATKRTGEQDERLLEIKNKLGEQAPGLLDKYGKELSIHGKLSDSLAELANKYTLAAKARAIYEQSQDVETKYAKTINQWQIFDTLSNGMFKGISHNPIMKAYDDSTQAIDTSIEALRKLIEQEKAHKKIIKEGLPQSEYTLGNLSSGSSKSKKHKEKRQLTASEQLQKDYSDSQRLLDDFATKGITSGEVWNKQVKVVKELANEIKNAKNATDQGLLEPLQLFNKQMQEAQERVNNLAASKIVDIKQFKQAGTELEQAKQKLREFQEQSQKIQIESIASPFQKMQAQKNNLEAQYLDLAIMKQGNTPQATALKNSIKQYETEMKRAQVSLESSMGVSWQNISSSISMNLSQAITTPLQQGESALERFGNVALNTFQMIAQSYISTFLNNKMQGIQQNGGLLNSIFGKNKGAATGGAAQIIDLKQEMSGFTSSLAPAAAGIAKIGTTQAASLAAFKGSSATLTGSISTYSLAAIQAQKLAASITQAAIAQAAYSAALVPVAGAALAPIAALATGASIGAANLIASGGMLAGRISAFADGGVFSNGKVLPFAKGTVLNSRTKFPMADGSTGLAGERNPEAIMPLTRGAGGRLGVEASNVNRPNINIYNQSSAQIETVQRPDGDYDIFIRKVNNALNNERTNAGFTRAMQRNNSKGIQAC